jgi:hypothetical protein
MNPRYQRQQFATPARLAALAGCVAAALAGAANAQSALGDGHALDANQQVGSDGRNAPVRDVQSLIRFNNAVVTGNAPYGRSFRGNVGYLASEDFRASLGSNDLFVPLRESAQSTLVGGGIRGTDALQYQFSLATGAPPPDILSGIGGGTVPRSMAAPPSTLITSGTLRSTASYLTSQALRPSLIGYTRDDDGEQLALTASPLTGVRTVPLRVTSRPGDAEPGGSLLSGLESTPRGVRGVLSASQALSRVDTSKPTRADQPQEDEAESNPFAQALRRATGEEEAAKPGEASLLDRLRRRLRGQLRPGEVDPLAVPERPQTKPDEKPAPEEIPSGEGFDLWGEGMDASNAELLRALRETRVPVERLGDDATVRPDAYRNHMAAGQSLLSQGRFFDAEDRFMRALSAAPDDLMATVGRVHAQIGAGLYLSAAANLRRTLTEHPEIVTAEYGPDLMPGPARTVEIVSQLRDHVHGPDLSLADDAALLLAYLGHHGGDGEAMREGLDRLEELTEPDDQAGKAMLTLLRSSWGG